MPKEAKTFEQMMEESDKVMMKYAQIKHKVQVAQMLVESIEENGISHTLQTLISLSTVEDSRIEEMLLMYPSMVCLNKFLKKIPNYEVDAKTFQYLIDQGVHFL
jgi:hypothetical protein